MHTWLFISTTDYALDCVPNILRINIETRVDDSPEID